MTRSKRSIATPILVGLLLVICGVAAFMWQTGRASGLEAVSFVTGAACVWLIVRENVWNFPIGLLNVATFSVVFFRAGLFADAGLQVVYFVLGCMGWHLWLYGGQQRTALRVARASDRELMRVTLFVGVATLSLWWMLSRVGGSASFFDALTTAISLASQWLLNRKRLESWIGWILVDVIYVPLYLYKDLYLTAVLYGVFLVMASIGLKQWHATWRRERMTAASPAGGDLSLLEAT